METHQPPYGELVGMKIEVNAKLILSIPATERVDDPADLVLRAEQHINNMDYFVMPVTGTRAGCRLHVKSGMRIDGKLQEKKNENQP